MTLEDKIKNLESTKRTTNREIKALSNYIHNKIDEMEGLHQNASGFDCSIEILKEQIKQRDNSEFKNKIHKAITDNQISFNNHFGVPRFFVIEAIEEFLEVKDTDLVLYFIISYETGPTLKYILKAEKEDVEKWLHTLKEEHVFGYALNDAKKGEEVEISTRTSYIKTEVLSGIGKSIIDFVNKSMEDVRKKAINKTITINVEPKLSPKDVRSIMEEINHQTGVSVQLDTVSSVLAEINTIVNCDDLVSPSGLKLSLSERFARLRELLGANND